MKIALRQLRKQKLYSVIKIGGFALGIAACLLIALYIRHELSYDRDYANGNRLYRVIQVYRSEDGSVGKGPAMPAGFAKAMMKEFPEVELAARIMPYPLFGGAGSNEVRAQGRVQNIYEEGFTYADQAMLEMFGFRMIYGDRAHALTEPGSMVLSKRKAEKYFPGQDPVGKVGLFALSAFMAERRRKEIGIRKVLGATVGQLTGLLSGEFVRLVLISIVIATPVAYWGMHVWLQDFVYRIDVGWWVFAVAGVLAVGIALLTISLQAVKAAMANPAGSLRAE